MPRYPFISEGEDLQTSAHGFPTFMDDTPRKHVVTANIWGYLEHVTRRNLSETKETPALAFLEQARDFYDAADKTSLSSRPLLYYYAYLNLTKVLLLNSGAVLDPKPQHGVSDRLNNQKRLHFKTQRVKVLKSTKAGKPPHHNLLLPTLMHTLDASSSHFFGKSQTVLQLMGQLPAIHRTYAAVTNKTEHFLPVQRFTVRKKDLQMWAVVHLSKSHITDSQFTALCDTAPLSKNLHRVCAHADDPQGRGSWILETDKVPYAPRSHNKGIAALAKKLRDVGVWSIATSGGYRHYLTTLPEKERLPQLAASFATMFYFGSITRYKPHDFDSIEEREGWLMSEFLSTDPYQMLYLTASTIGKTEVVAPYAIHG